MPSIPQFSSGEKSTALQLEEQTMVNTLSFVQLSYIWNSIGRSIEGVPRVVATTKREMARLIVQNRQKFKPVLQALLETSSNEGIGVDFNQIPRSECSTGSVVCLFLEQKLFGKGSIQGSRINIVGRCVTVRITQLENEFVGHELEYHDSPITVGSEVVWSRDDVVDERVYLSFLERQSGVEEFDDISRFQRSRIPSSVATEASSSQEPMDSLIPPTNWQEMYTETLSQNESMESQLAHFKKRTQALEQFITQGVHMMREMTKNYKQLNNTEIVNEEVKGFTLNEKLYEISDKEYTTLMKGVQPIVLLRIVVKHVAQDLLPLLNTKGYCLPGTKIKNNPREKLDERTVKLLTMDTKAFIPHFRGQPKTKLRQWLGETLTELNKERQRFHKRSKGNDSSSINSSE